MSEQPSKAFIDSLIQGARPSPGEGPPAFLSEMLEAQYVPPTQRQVQDIGGAIIAGLHASSGGLAWRGETPGLVLGEDAPIEQRLAAGVGGIVGDVPAMIAGGLAMGIATRNPIAMGAGVFAAPMALREALIQAYGQQGAMSWSDAWDIAKRAFVGAAKGAVIGGVTVGAGKLVEPFLQPLGRTAAVGGGLTTELTALTTTAAAVEGHMPSAQDFLDNAILLGGLKFSVSAARTLREMYADTGIKPEDAINRAMADPVLRDAILGRDAKPKGKLFQRFEEKGEAIGTPDKPQGLYTTPAELKSPHADLGGTKSLWELDPTAKVLEIEPFSSKEIALRKYALDAGAGVHAARQLLGKDIFQELKKGSKQDVVAFANKNFPGPDYARYFDKQEVIEAIGAQAARAAKYDAIFVRDELLPEFNEMVLLNSRMAKPFVEGPVQMPPDIIEMAIDQRVKAALSEDARPEMLRQMMAEVKEAPKLGESPMAKLINWDYMIDQPTLRALLSEIEGMYSAEIAKQTRGVVPNRQTAAEGLRMAVDGELGSHLIGRAENAKQLIARTHFLRAASDNVFNTMKALEGKAEAELTTMDKLGAAAAMERLAMVVADFRGARAEAGRSLQIFRALKRDLTLFGAADNLIKLYEKQGKVPFTGLAKMVGAFKDSAQMVRFAEDIVKPGRLEKVMEAWKAAILSGPQTHLANMMGNMTKWLVEVPESTLAASIEASRRIVQGDPMNFQQFKARAFQPIIGLQLGAKDGLITAWEVLKQEGSHLEKADIYRHAIEGRMGEAIRLPFRALQAEDVLFRTPAERGKAYELAVDRATREKVMPGTREWNETVQKYLDKPDTGLTAEAAAQVAEAIQQAGGEAVFAQRLGQRLELVQRAMANTPLGFVIPFVRTPANLVSWAMQHTPGLNLLSGRWRADFAAGGERQSRALARVAIGTGLAVTAYQWALDGTLTGGGMFDPELRKTKAAAGWQPYSIKIGNKYYSYQRIEPVSKVLGIAADLVEMIEASNDDEDKAKAGAMLVALFGNATISTTYLSGLANAVQALSDPERYGPSMLEQYAASLVPKIVGQTVMMTDPFKREVDDSMDAIQSQLPWLRQKLLPKRDVWGDPVKNEKLWATLPIQVTEVSRDKVKTETERLQVALTDAPRYVYESGPFRARERQIELTPEQRDIFRQVQGKAAMEILAPLVASKQWEDMPDLAKALTIRGVVRLARERAQYKALPPDSAERVKKRTEILKKIMQEYEPQGR